MCALFGRGKESLNAKIIIILLNFIIAKIMVSSAIGFCAISDFYVISCLQEIVVVNAGLAQRSN